MFKRQCCTIFFLYSVLAVSSVQAMFRAPRPPKVKAPKARVTAQIPTIPKTPIMPKAPTISTPGMASSEMFEPSPFSAGEDISPLSDVPTISTTPAISTEMLARAPRSVNVPKAPSWWKRITAYWTQKRAYHTTAPQYQEKKSPGSSAGFEFNFSFNKLFKFQNPFSWKTWSAGSSKSYGSRSSTMSHEEIDKWFEDYKERKYLSRGMYREHVDVMKHILLNAKNDSQAVDYLYRVLEFLFANIDEDDNKDPKVVAGLNELALIALSMKLDRFVNLFRMHGFPTTSSYYEQKYGSAGSSEKTESGKQESAGTGSAGRQYSRTYKRGSGNRAESVPWFRKYMGIPEDKGVVILDAATHVFNNDVNNEEALYYLYPLVEDWLRVHRIFNDDPAKSKEMNAIYKIALKHKHLADYVKLFEENGFGKESSKQKQEKKKEQTYRKKEDSYKQSSGQYQGKSEERSYNRSYSAGTAKGSDYDILSVKQGASSEEIHKKYLELVNKYHPDKIRSRGGSEQEMKEGEQKLKAINAAYDRIGRK